MKIIYVFIFFMSFGLNAFSYNVDDYIFFNKALNENQKGDYKKSLFFYEIYQNNFSYSYPLTSNYAKYYIAKNYMDMGKYDEALLFFSRAVYVPKAYVEQKFKKTNFFQYRRDYLVAEIYLKKGMKQEAYQYLNRLVTNYYDPELKMYEKKALKILEKSDLKYKYIYEIKYQNNFSSLKKLNKNLQVDLSNYFYEKKEYEKVIFILDSIDDYSKNSLELKIRYLDSLLKMNENKKVLELTKNIGESEWEIIFLRALAYEQSKDYSRAVFNYKKVQDVQLKNKANFRIARIYYKLEYYTDSKKYLDKITEKNEDTDSLLLEIYIKLQNKKKYIYYYDKFKNEYPENPKMGLYYIVYNKLINGSKNPWELSNYNVFFASNYVVRTYINSLEEFNLNNTYKEEVLKEALSKIGELKKSELLDLAIQSNIFDLDVETTEDKITIINSFVSSKFYRQSFEKMKNYRKDFYKYKNLLHYIYPKYYREEVQKARQKYLLPQSLIYTIMYIESGFDNESNKFERVGLMGIPKDAMTQNEDYYYNPEKNIEVGISLLKKIYNKNNNMVLKTLIEYICGKKVFESLSFELDGDLKLETITDEKLQKEIEKIVYTYAFYSAIYN